MDTKFDDDIIPTFSDDMGKRLIKIINDIGIIKIAETAGDISTLTYLDYIYTDGTDIKDTKTLGLGLKAKSIELEYKDVEAKPGEDIELVVANKILSEIIKAMRKIAISNTMKYAPAQEYLNLTNSENVKYSLITRTVAMSNHVAVIGRRGPANFVIASKDTLMKMIDPDKSELLVETLSFDTRLAGMKMLVCDELGSTVLVGRKPIDLTEPSVTCFTNAKALSNFSFDNLDIIKSRVGYKVDSFGSILSYMSFTVEHGS